MILTFISVLIIVVLFFPVLVIYFSKKYCFRKRKELKEKDDSLRVAFFHPYCNAGGGGERVLWCSVRAIQNRYPNVKVAVYTGDINASPNEILNKVSKTFNIALKNDIEIVYLHRRHWVEAKRYPYFTLLGQAIGSVILGIEALFAYVPDIYIDSMGYSFTLLLFSYIGKCTTACYIHYPTITKEMVKRVALRTMAHNNNSTISHSPFLSSAKLIYYKLFSWLYSFCGSFADTVMVNSSWTEDHINNLWNCSLSTHRIYPPCNTANIKALPMAPDISEGGLIKIVSVGQYRPEKDHPLQLQAIFELRNLLPEEIFDRVKLVFIGSCRDSMDHMLVKDMKDLCKHLSLENNVEFKVNVPYEELKQELLSSMIGLHAMWNEHFGIGIVECMAAGQIMVAHRSGGPKADIIEESEGSRNGFLAADEHEYGRALAAIIKMSPQARNKIREAARSSVDRFSEEEFEKGILRTLDPLFSQRLKTD